MQFKKNLSSDTKWEKKLKVCFYHRYCCKFILTSSFICNPPLHFSMRKSYADIYHPPTYAFVITGAILITIIRFASYQ